MWAIVISATLVVYNEEKKIRPALESIKNVVDEIIVVHDGPCTDKTLDICKEYNTRTYVRPRIGEANPHRQFSFTKARGDWILQIDADERLSNEAQQQLRKLVKKKSVDTYAFRWKDSHEQCILGIWPIKKYKPCLVRKSKLKFEGLQHEPVGTTGNLEKVELILHHEERPISDPDTFRRKTRTWALVGAKMLIQKNSAPHNSYYYLIKSVTYALAYFVIYSCKGYILCGKEGYWTIRYHTTFSFLQNYYLYKIKSRK